MDILAEYLGFNFDMPLMTLLRVTHSLRVRDARSELLQRRVRSQARRDFHRTRPAHGRASWGIG